MLPSPANAEPASLADALMDIANVPPSWAVLDPAVAGDTGLKLESNPSWIATVEASAAVMGTALSGPADLRQIAANFFNAGVSLLKLRDDSFANSRVLLNALGLYWALKKSRGEVAQALGPLKGLSAAVNLFGAIVPLQRDLRSARRLAQVLAAYKAEANMEESDDFFRLEGSWKRLGFEGLESSALSDSPVEVLAALIAELTGQAAQGLTSVDEAEASRTTAGLVRDSLSEAFGPAAYAADLQRLMVLLDRVVDLAKDIDRTWAELYGPLADMPGSLGRGPLVESGVMSADEWGMLAQRSMPKYAIPVSRLLGREQLDWMT